MYQGWKNGECTRAEQRANVEGNKNGYTQKKNNHIVM